MSISEPSCPAEEQASGNAAGNVNTTEGCSLPHQNVVVHKHYSGPGLTQCKNKTSASSFLFLCLSSSLQWQLLRTESAQHQCLYSCYRLNNQLNLYGYCSRRQYTAKAAVLFVVMYGEFICGYVCLYFKQKVVRFQINPWHDGVQRNLVTKFAKVLLRQENSSCCLFHLWHSQSTSIYFNQSINFIHLRSIIPGLIQHTVSLGLPWPIVLVI